MKGARMIPRYRNAEIEEIWTDEVKLKLWQEVELRVIEVREKAGEVPEMVAATIRGFLEEHPCDVKWWKERDSEIGHDLNAFIDERLRFLPEALHQYFHAGMTSYDTEELPFQVRLLESAMIILKGANGLAEALAELAEDHAVTPMLARTHGQWAKLQSFGKRVLSWRTALVFAIVDLQRATEGIQYSKLSGAVGNYQGISPVIEKKVLGTFDFQPYYGATQIVPRVVHASLASAIARLVLVINNIAMDIRLSGRSGYTLMQEPFGKKQKGSSAMPHKKNTILTEQVAGLARMAKGYAAMLTENIETWEERAIEQSCVERVAWPDLFHVSARAIEVMTKVTSKLVVNVTTMQKEIDDSHGVYASEEAKDFLKQHDFTHEEAYRIVQLASFCAAEQGKRLDKVLVAPGLLPNTNVAHDASEIASWNERLERLFENPELRAELSELFNPEYHLRNEGVIFKETL